MRRQVQHGESYVTHRNGIVHGTSKINATIGHQHDSSLYPTSAVSTSLNIEIAKKYATRNFTNVGVIYKINCNKLEIYNIEMINVSESIEHPRFPNDQEILLREKNNGNLSMNIVAEVIEIKLKHLPAKYKK